MRFVFLLGGVIGFGVAAAGSHVAGHGTDRVFLDATVGCLCGAVLFRWFWRVLLRGLREVVVQRQAAAEAPHGKSPPL